MLHLFACFPPRDRDRFVGEVTANLAFAERPGSASGSCCRWRLRRPGLTAILTVSTAAPGLTTSARD